MDSPAPLAAVNVRHVHWRALGFESVVSPLREVGPLHLHVDVCTAQHPRLGGVTSECSSYLLNAAAHEHML